MTSNENENSRYPKWLLSKKLVTIPKLDATQNSRYRKRPLSEKAVI